jgi:hypothetical protein
VQAANGGRFSRKAKVSKEAEAHNMRRRGRSVGYVWLKAKGRLPLRDAALSIRFLEDLVRHPDRDSLIAVLFGNCEQSPHFPHSSVISIAIASSLPSFQLPGVSTVAGPLKCPWSALFFWRISPPLERIVSRQRYKTTAPRK